MALGAAQIILMSGPTREVAMDVNMDAREMELLMRVLDRYLEDLRREIHHTDTRAFKMGLKADEALMESILGKLRAPAAMGI